MAKKKPKPPAPIDLANITIPDNAENLPRRCGARSKNRPGHLCLNRPEYGSTRCRFHGGGNYGKPNLHNLTHGAASKYVPVALLPKVLEIARGLDKHDGRVEATKVRYAVTAARSENIPQDDTGTELWLKAASQMHRDVQQVHDLEKVDAPPPQAPIFQIATFDGESQAPILGRTLEGPVQIMLVAGNPYILDAETGALWPAVKRRDKETGAEVYAKVLKLSAGLEDT